MEKYNQDIIKIRLKKQQIKTYLLITCFLVYFKLENNNKNDVWYYMEIRSSHDIHRLNEPMRKQELEVLNITHRDCYTVFQDA